MTTRTTAQRSHTCLGTVQALLVVAMALAVAAGHAALASACAAPDATPAARAAVPATRPSTTPAGAGDAQRYTYQRRTRDGIGKVYMGREIAQVMGHLAAGWLERRPAARRDPLRASRNGGQARITSR